MPLTSRLLTTAVCLIPLSVSTASAQVVGAFRWQFAPFCNVVTLRVEQQGSVYQLSGTDDLCGAAVHAAARGTAHLNPDGTVGMALTVLRPDAISVSIAVTLNLATLSGTWTDEFENSGSFTYAPPAAPGGSRRPVRLMGHYAISFTAAAAGNRGTEGISFGLTFPDVPGAAATNFIAAGGAPTANCPGSTASPDAIPGQLCVYESSRANVGSQCIASTATAYSCNGADRTGASVYITSSAAGTTTSAGRWIVVMP